LAAEEEAPRTQVFVAIDVATEGPEATALVDAALADHDYSILSWRYLNPASDADRETFIAIGDRLRRTFEEEAPMDPLDTVLGEGTDGQASGS